MVYFPADPYLPSTIVPHELPFCPSVTSSPVSLLHPVAAIAVDLHNTVLVQRVLGVHCVKVMVAHHIPSAGIQPQGGRKATIKLDFLA